ncbi:MAG: metallophosphoesterase family protein [Anaerolineae bacterium]
MRVLIFSDLHANWEALLAMQAAERKPDAILFLGDAVDFGPDPLVSVRWLRKNADYGVRGNHDNALATGMDCLCEEEYRHLALATRKYTARTLSPEEISYLGEWPLEVYVDLGGAHFYLTHAAPSNHLFKYLNVATAREEELREEIAGIEADVIFLGHTHIPAIRKVEDTYLVNPGSLGQPRHGTPSGTYALWEDGELAIRHVDYNWAETQRKLALLPLQPEEIERLQDILERGGR